MGRSPYSPKGREMSASLERFRADTGLAGVSPGDGGHSPARMTAARLCGAGVRPTRSLPRPPGQRYPFTGPARRGGGAEDGTLPPVRAAARLGQRVRRAHARPAEGALRPRAWNVLGVP